MEKRLLLALALIALVMIISNTLFTPTPPPTPVAEEPAVTAHDSPPAASIIKEEPRTVTKEILDLALEKVEPADADTVTVSTDLCTYQFSTLGGILLKAELIKYESFAKNEEYVQLIPEEGSKFLSSVIEMDGRTVDLSQLNFQSSTKSLYLSQERTEGKTDFTYQFESGQKILLTYSFKNDSYAVGAELKILDNGTAIAPDNVSVNLGPGLRSSERNIEEDYTFLAGVLQYDGQPEEVKPDDIEGNGRTFPVAVRWAGLKTKYFISLLASPSEDDQFETARVEASDSEYTTRILRFGTESLFDELVKNDFGIVVGRLRQFEKESWARLMRGSDSRVKIIDARLVYMQGSAPGLTLDKGLVKVEGSIESLGKNSFNLVTVDKDEYKVLIRDPLAVSVAPRIDRASSSTAWNFYIGPQDYESLATLGVGAENVIQYGWWIVKPISQFTLIFLIWLHKWIANYGLVIIIFSVLIKIVFFPLSQKSVKSMKEMQKLQPKIESLKQRYKNDPKKMQAETMALYKEHKVNPLGGCLPMLIQFPFLIAMFYVLQRSVELRGAEFVLWLSDLSIPDPFYVFPLIMGVSMLAQQMQTPSTGNPQQKMMMYFMPVFFTFISFSFPVGLVLYWTVTNLLTIAQQSLLPKGTSEKQPASKKKGGK